MKLIKWIVHHKSLATQGAGYIQLFCIFFLASRSLQDWVIKQYDVTINVVFPMIGMLTMAWMAGWILERTGIIRTEQTWLADRNDVFKRLEGDK